MHNSCKSRSQESTGYYVLRKILAGKDTDLVLFFIHSFRYYICKLLVRVLYVYLKHGIICILDCTQCFRDERRSSVGLL